MTKIKQPADVYVYQMKVTLEDISPPISRRIQVTNDTTLGKLHRILQIIMGWSDYHLHEFVIGGVSYGVPDKESVYEVKNERNVRLSQVVSKKQTKFSYIYDFGDYWQHKILIEKILPLEPDMHYPICIKGKRACPPEDCGGVGGYEDFLETIHDPNHPEHDEMLEWVGGSFDPEAFDIDEINRELKKIR
ncbi:MAG: plasmid pRiA4b ORF-3 family protein [Candidatus Methanoperedens sp.]|nr:plasmid pRiA4b ORF-3 family protein [Candidatus Methanoperedens sp.]